MNKLEAIKNVFRELDKECKKYEKCGECPREIVCERVMDGYIPEDILYAIENNEILKDTIRPTIQEHWVREGHLIKKLNEEVLEFTKARTVDNTIEEFWDVVQCLVNCIDYFGISEEMIMEGLKVHNEKLLKRGWKFKK